MGWLVGGVPDDPVDVEWVGDVPAAMPPGGAAGWMVVDVGQVLDRSGVPRAPSEDEAMRELEGRN